MNVALILCGGVGNRFGGGLPKQYLPVAGHMCVEYVIRACCEAESVEKVVVCAAPPYEYLLPLREKYDFDLTPSGAERNGTIHLGLEYIHAHYACEKLAVIDSARPLTTAALIDTLMEKLDGYDAAIQCRHLCDALGHYGEQDVDRSQYFSIQTPECFRFDVFYRYFREEFPATCLLNHLPLEASRYLYFDFINNLKMTYPEDIDFLTYVLEKRRREEA